MLRRLLLLRLLRLLRLLLLQQQGDVRRAVPPRRGALQLLEVGSAAPAPAHLQLARLLLLLLPPLLLLLLLLPPLLLLLLLLPPLLLLLLLLVGFMGTHAAPIAQAQVGDGVASPLRRRSLAALAAAQPVLLLAAGGHT